MSENHPESSQPEPRDADAAEWDLDAEWEAARAATERDQASPPGAQACAHREPPAEISAYALLYTGFLLGPPSTLLGVLILMGRRFRLRPLIFALGICGATWLVSQGATLGLRADWTPASLQIMRTALNFIAGVVLLGFVTAKTDIQLAHTPKVWLNTGVFFLILLLISSSLSPTALFWLGR